MLASFAIVAGVVVIGDGRLLWNFETKPLSLLEKQQGNVKLLFVEQYHRDKVAQLTQSHRCFLILLTVEPIGIPVDVKELLVYVKCLLVFGLFLVHHALFLEGLHSVFEGGVHLLPKIKI